MSCLELLPQPRALYTLTDTSRLRMKSSLTELCVSRKFREDLLSGRTRRDQNESLQSLMRETTSLNKSERMLDEMVQQGAGALQDLNKQRTTLKGAQRRIMVCCPAWPNPHSHPH